MKCYTIAQVVNYVNMHKDFFGITKERACWADCTVPFRVSKLSTHYNMQLFELFTRDNTAQVFLPAAVKKSDFKKALKLTQNTKFTDFFDGNQEWCFMQVTPNRMLVFDQIVKNTMPKVEQKPSEVEELKARIKELEGQLAQIKKVESRVLTPYMQDYTQPWTDKRFCEYFGITGYIDDDNAEPNSEWEIILNTMKEYV